MSEAASEERRPKNWLDPVKEAKAVAALRASLADVDDADEALLIDTIEGETELFEIIDRILVRMAETRALIIGAEAVEGELYERRKRFEKRLDSDRALIEQALSIAELPKLERPAATLSMSARAPSLVVTEEAEIPAKYWKTGDPKLDRKALIADLAARKAAIDTLPDDEEARKAALAALEATPDIPGVTLSNAAPSLSVRTR